MRQLATVTLTCTIISALACMEKRPDADVASATPFTKVVLTRNTAVAVLSVDSLWQRDRWVAYMYQTGGMACDAWHSAGARDSVHRVLMSNGWIAYRDTSYITADSVAHGCVEEPQGLAERANEQDAFLLEYSPDAGGDIPSTWEVNIRAARVRFDTIAGILQRDGDVEATVEFSERDELTELGLALGVVVTRHARRALLRRYDDGWRVALITGG